MSGFFRVFRDKILDSLAVHKTPVQDHDAVNKKYLELVLDDYITGPMSVTSDRVVLFDGTSGVMVKESTVVIDILGNASGFNALGATGSITAGGITNMNGGGVVPAGQVLTITDAPAVGTSAANKDYVDSVVAGGTTLPGFALTKTLDTMDVQVDDISIAIVGAGNGYLNIKNTWTGQNSITTLGTITAGIWNAGAIDAPYTNSTDTTNQYRIDSVDYLAYEGGTAAAPSALLVGPTGMAGVSVAGFGNTIMGSGIGPGAIVAPFAGNTMIGNGIGSTSVNFTGDYNVFVGDGIAQDLNGGVSNVAMGRLAASVLSSGTNNVCMGDTSAQSLTTGSFNVVAGSLAADGLVSGSNNVCLGEQAGSFIGAASDDCIYMGYRSGGDGSDNIAIGNQALGQTTTGQHVAIGTQSFFGATVALGNVGLGYEAGKYTTGGSNVCLGFQAGLGVNGVTAYSDTVCLGNETATGFRFGNNGIFIGSGAGSGNTGLATDFASDCILIGKDTDSNDNSNVVVLGNGGAATAANQLMVNSTITDIVMAGILTAAVGAGTNLVISAGGQIIRDVSSRRYKDNITDIELDTSLVLDLRPVSFNYISEETRTFGLIAEEVAELLPEAVNHNVYNQVESVNYRMLTVPLIAEVKKNRNEISELKARLLRLEALMGV